MAFYSIPLPWLAAELGWFVAEFGRQPWIIEGVLPTAIGVSDLGIWQVALTIFGFVLFYSVLAVVEVALLIKYIRLGPQPETSNLPAQAYRCPARRPRSEPNDPLRTHRLRHAEAHLVGAARRAADRLCRHRWLRHGRRHAACRSSPGRDIERRVAINTVGPVWEGNQVWFILGGGAIFAAWPPLYAVSFSGFYLAMFVVLAALILRPVAFKYRSKRPDPRWRNAWDWALFVGGFVPALIFGVAVGNVLQGVPFPAHRRNAHDLRRHLLRPAQPVRAAVRAAESLPCW